MIGTHVKTAPVIHTDDTPVPLLSPGLGRTRTGRLWVYLTDERSWQGPRTPAAWHRFSPDRKGERPREHLAGYEGTIQADAYGGYEALTRESAARGRNMPRIQHAACWAHARRKLFEEFERTKSPIAQEALRQIGEFYAIEAELNGEAAERRALVRREQSLPLLTELKRYLQEQRRRLSAKANLAKAINYALGRWEALCLYTTDGRIGIDNNPAERALRGIAITRKNFLFLGSEAGGDRAAIIYTVLETAKLNGLDPEAYLANIIDRMAKGHPAHRLNELLPWNWKTEQTTADQAPVVLG
jgi:hypothetical protein